ncbi:MAG: hypothetical protein K2L89_04015 [Muribaculaceae bacterium]|nr:hypothetical protein [Muribaculaceae bacterium]
MDNRRSQHIDSDDSVMRFDVVYTLLALCGAALIGWAISLIPEIKDVKTLVWILSGVSSAIYLLCYGNSGTSRSAIVIKYTSWTTLLISNLILAIMSIWCENSTYFILVASVIALCFVAIAYSVAKANQ